MVRIIRDEEELASMQDPPLEELRGLKRVRLRSHPETEPSDGSRIRMISNRLDITLLVTNGSGVISFIENPSTMEIKGMEIGVGDVIEIRHLTSYRIDGKLEVTTYHKPIKTKNSGEIVVSANKQTKHIIIPPSTPC